MPKLVPLLLLASLALPLAVSASSPAGAAASEWIAHEGGRVRIVAAPPREDGTVRAILDIELDPGWKTYWMDPGESGIPPAIDTSGSRNLGPADILFPAPERVDDGYSVWAGYTQSVRLPLLLRAEAPQAPSFLKAGLLFGVCEKVCVPVQADVALSIDGTTTPLHRAMIERAFSELPAAGDETLGLSRARLTGNGAALRITAVIPESAAAHAELFLAAPAGWAFGVPKAVDRAGGATVFEARVKRRPKDPRGEPVLHGVLKTLTRSVAADLPLDE